VRLLATEKGFVCLHRGDCYSRGLILQKLVPGEKFLESQTAYHCSGYYGEEGQHSNSTHTMMGGIAAATDTYAVVGKSERFYASSDYATYETGDYDVFVRIVAQDETADLPLAGEDRIDEVTGEVADQNVIWLTSCDENTKAGNVKVVTLADNTYCVLWEVMEGDQFDHISYVILDQYGNLLQAETPIYQARLSNSSMQPVVQGSVLTWAVTDKEEETITWYSVDLQDKLLRGDVNEDGTVDVADVVLLQQYLLREETLTETQWTAGDMTRDSKLNVLDLELLKEKTLQ
jgi:hypothetical protein